MPTWLPENNIASSQDDELRSLRKIADIAYDSAGYIACSFPEGNRPVPGDDATRLKRKIVVSLNG